MEQLSATSSITVRQTKEWQEIDQLFWRIYRNSKIQIALEQALFPSLFMIIQQQKNEPDLIRLEKYANFFNEAAQLSDEFITYIQQVEETIEGACKYNHNLL